MAPNKKTVAPVTEKKATAPVAVEAPKTAATVKAEPAKEADVKVETAKKEETAKKAPVKKETVKKAEAATVKSTPAKKEEVKTAVHIQYGGRSYADEDLIGIAKDVWKYDLNQKVEDLTNVALYVKPEENKVYYVMNDIAGSFDI